ncbi:MAG: CpsD/CapB family tyrosine-protein kinase [Planctomycetes bacterium]|nr:CpsD/CapB family tyrosine-protein kinase [Planctomycetota bacterium]
MAQLNQTRTELIQTKEEEQSFKDLLEAEQLKLTEQGNASLDIKDMQFDVDLDMEIFDQLSRRIKQLELEKNRKPRITIVEDANRVRYEDKRIPYSAGMAMGVFGLGCLLALLIDKADKRLKEPEEVAALTNLPLIGTVANARTVKAAKFAEQIASDYQTIRTNLTLLGTSGMPKLLCVTSPGPREGKSSFSVNLATSLSKSGERVLLIDGDLRKPDTLRKMNFAHMTEQVSHVPIEGGSEYSIWTVDATGLDILVPNAGNRGDVYELIASPVMAHRIMTLSKKYDHVIIDTPPVLAFPDAIIWARMSGVAIMIGFAGKTTSNDLIEAKERLGQTSVQLLGTVLNNVKVSHGYQRYRYGYYDHKGGRRDLRMNKKLMMTAREAPKTQTSKLAKE